jgi:integrase
MQNEIRPNSVTKTRPDGSKITYHYAWKGGPRLLSEKGTRAFDDELKAAHVVRVEVEKAVAAAPKHAGATLEMVVDKYLDSQEFLTCGERTRRDYRLQTAKIVKAFGDLPVETLVENPDETRGLFLDHRDELAKASIRQADYFMQVLNTVLNWGKVRGKLKLNPLRDAGVKKLYDVTRADKTWTDVQIDEFRSRAQPEINLAMMLALWTGQRQGDLLRLTWSAYDGAEFKICQGKGRVQVQIPVGAPLKKLLDATQRKSPLILVNSSGIPWTEDGFRTMWHKTAKRAGIVDRTFHDLRGTTVTKLALAGCTVPEIASITGHSLTQVKSILEKHYLARDPALAKGAISKLEAGQKKSARISSAQKGLTLRADAQR